MLTLFPYYRQPDPRIFFMDMNAFFAATEKYGLDVSNNLLVTETLLLSLASCPLEAGAIQSAVE